ncbi:hypothetical protein TWF718_008973 [Orbilia javanica]|uniref:Uncharacterized protein n=1 Tax=Orbilia javanica TaxID=47235 RepID=A0AAN8RBB6_9PEZI
MFTDSGGVGGWMVLWGNRISPDLYLRLYYFGRSIIVENMPLTWPFVEFGNSYVFVGVAPSSDAVELGYVHYNFDGLGEGRAAIGIRSGQSYTQGRFIVCKSNLKLYRSRIPQG